MQRKGTNRRQGAAIVEMAAVSVVFLMLLFGIIEYCRFIFFQQLFYNASREGARYAVVNSTDATIVTDTKAKVKSYLNGLDTKVTGYSCSVFWADAAGNSLGTPDNAPFGQYIAVDVQGTYSPILPSFLRMNSSIVIRSKTLMYSEAN